MTPLWPSLESNLSLENGGIFWLVVLWTTVTSFCQLLFGYLGDRGRRRWLLWAGPAVAIACLSSIGLVRSPLVLAILLVVAGLGIAAFHPEAAAIAGASAPLQRSRAMAVFALGGYFGQSVGPFYSGTIAQHFGLPALAWTAAWGFGALGVLTAAMFAVRQPQVALQKRRGAADAAIFRPIHVAVLLFVGVMRVVAPVGVPLAAAYLLDARGAGADEIGLVQSAFMFGIGGGGLACALFIGRRQERTALWLSPLCAVPLLAATPFMQGAALLACAAASGLFLGAAMPVLISIGQQMLPGGQRVASSITMGVSWGIGGALATGLVALFRSLDQMTLVFGAFALAAILSSLLSLQLPKLES